MHLKYLINFVSSKLQEAIMKKKYSRFLLLCIIPLYVLSSGCRQASNSSTTGAAIVEKNRILAATPPMGWNSWNCFGTNIDENKIKAVVDAMISTGMKDAGYEYINLDDGWMAEKRDANGNLQSHPAKFPNGIKALADYVHSKGLKLGLYSSNGINTCARSYPGSLGNEEKDARLLVQWGVDYFKYDWCNHASTNYSPDIDKISITPFASKGQAKENFYEAESPDNTLDGTGNGKALVKDISVKKDNQAIVLGKKVTNIGNNNGSLQFNNVAAPSDGEYEMKIYYSNPDFPFRKAFISINGEKALEAEIPFPGEVVNGSPVIALEEPPQMPAAVGAAPGAPPAGLPPGGAAPAAGPPTGGAGIGSIMSQQDVMGAHTIKIKLKAGKNTIKFFNTMTEKDNAVALYSRMSTALKKAYDESSRPDKRQVVLSICEWGSNEPWTWGKGIGQLWRTTGDLFDSFSSMLSNMDKNAELAEYAGPGHWNDPDMLEIGNGGMIETECRSHFSLWCMMASPLLMGNDLSKMSDSTRIILMNKDAIAIDQDPLGVQGKRIRKDADTEVWMKPLANGDMAVLLFNRGASEKEISASFDELGLKGREKVTAWELWDKTEKTMTGAVGARVPSHGAALMRLLTGK
jgi:alpha-galactosidase